MKKYISIVVGIILASFLIAFYKYLTFYPQQAIFFGKEINFQNYIENFYVKYFYQKNADPLYVWNHKSIDNYIDNCEKCLMFPHQQTYADILWLGSIQYIGSVMSAADAPNLYEMLNNLTNLNPYWDYPYIFGQLMLPISKTQEKEVPKDKKENSWQEAVSLGKKGVKYNCDTEKIKKISNLNEGKFYNILNNKGKKWDSLKNPCSTSDIPSYLGFNYFYYLGDWQNSSKYYKISAFNEDSPPINSSMVGIVKGRQGQHLKSMQVWFSKFLSLQEKLNTLSNQEKIKMYKDRLKKAYNTALMEYHLYILKNATKNTKEVNCKHDYNCLKENGKIQKVLQQEINQCKQYSYNPKNIYKNSPIKLNEKNFKTKAKCMLLSNSLNSGKTQPNNGQLICPKSKKNKNFIYYWNKERQDWRIKLKS